MGRIKKVATERHTATASPFVLGFVDQATKVQLAELPEKLASFPHHWPFPRGDLYHWIPLLDRFDHILELFNKEYGLVSGPQQEPFESRLLKKGDAEDGMPYSTSNGEAVAQDWSSEGDRELVESVISFTRVLLEHCGNRSLYASSGHLNDLLNTTSQNLLRLVLRLCLRLAQRYQVARYKNGHPHAQQVLLQNHYNLNLDRLHKIAEPFPKPPHSQSSASTTPGKGKDKSTHVPTYNPCDIVAIAKEPKSTLAKGDVVSVHLTYYEHVAPNPKQGPSQQHSEASPNTPTPVRRTSTLGPNRERPAMAERSATTGDVNSTTSKSKELDSAPSFAPKSYTISCNKVADTPAWALVREALTKVPEESAYDVLNRIRISKAFASAETSSQPLLEIRLLAIANLAYALSDNKFHEKIGTPDHEEPKRFHLAQQLCDLLQPPTNGQTTLTLETEAVVLLTIEALAKTRHKTSEIADALQISHNHGVLYYELRKAVSSLGSDKNEDDRLEQQENEWREATFDLTNTLLQVNAQASYGDRMVAAGIMSILIEGLAMTTARAQRFHEKILQFFDSFIHGIPTAFQTLANIKGLDIIGELMSHETTAALQNAKDGKGLPAEFKSKVVDYEIPFYQQSTLRQLFKFMTHMYEHNAGTHDRLLRNLIDTPQVLGALRNVIENGKIFGSNVWSGAVNIMSSFIHNEPTSFQVVGEAGLVKSLLQTIASCDLDEATEDETKLEDVPVALEYKDGKLQYPTPTGILPVGETMCDIPSAFGAVCLNESGMKLFQSSKALMKFMDIFISPPHVKALEEDGHTATTIGQAFDELSRHHPQLKEQIMAAVMAMIKRVSEVCKYLAEQEGVGAKLWERTPAGVVVSGGKAALAGPNAIRGDSGSETIAPDSLGEEAQDRVSGVPFLSACFKFLDGFFHNNSMCSFFSERGGAEYLLDLVTTASNPYDLVAFPVFSKIAHVLKTMCEAKPHLVLPSLIRRTQLAIESLKPLVGNVNSAGAFAAFSDLTKPQISSLPGDTNGTTVVKSLAVLHMLTHILGRALSPPQFSPSRHSHSTNQLFSIMNFADVYIELVDSLSQLHAACVWESLTLQKGLPEELKQSTDPRPFMMRRADANGRVEMAAEVRTDQQSNGETSNSTPKPEGQEQLFGVKNMKAVRYLLNQTPMGIEAFFLSLGHALVPKRTADPSVRQYAGWVADSLAKALVWELDYNKFDTADERLKSQYTMQMVTACSRTMLRNGGPMAPVGEFGSKEALTLVLNKFYLAGGFKKLNECLFRFSEQLAKFQKDDKDGLPAISAITTILSFYQYVVRAKVINEASQTPTITVRDNKQADYFTSSQLIVELRDVVLPAVKNLWESPALEAMGDNHAKTIIDILRTILRGDGEERAIKRNEKATRKVVTSKPEFKLRNTEGLRGLTSSGHDHSLAREALFRCNNHETNASEYCNLRKICDSAPSFPIPDGEPVVEAEPSTAANSSGAHGPAESSETQPLQRQRSVEMPDAGAEQANREDATAQPESEGGDDAETETESSADADLMDGLDGRQLHISGLPPGIPHEDMVHMIGQERFNDIARLASAAPPSKDTHQLFTTIEDLDEKRSELRNDLIDRCLEVLSAQPKTTFDLAELIQAAVAKSGESANPRADIGRTLVLSLLSLQGEEPSEESGAKIAAYAHLVALILQDQDFFHSTLDELKESFDPLVAWVQLGQDQKAEEAPWINMILLIIERVLAEDEQPVEATWQPPPADDPLKALPEFPTPEPVVSEENRTSLFDALVDLLPKIGKDKSLALSVCRVLATLTRRRHLALRLSDKHSISRLFVMVRQLAGHIDDKLQGSIMIILRHMIEDEEILRQIMRTEIRTLFENHRSGRAYEFASYIRNLHHLVIREPSIFLDVTKELVEIARYDGQPNRPQGLMLKSQNPATAETERPAEIGENENETDGKSKESAQEEPAAQPSIEEGSGEAPKQPELKPPTVEVTDGVVQFLLRELSNYKDVEEKPTTAPKDKSSELTNGTGGDVDMSDASSSANQPTASSTESGNKNEKPTFNPEEHTIYIYRCFIMQCLSEILASYNRTKVEFINFSRKPETQPATPSKPRAGTLNYLLNGLIPVGTLEHRDDIAHRKKLSTSHWATTVVVSLCSKTSELQTPFAMRNQDPNDEEYNLTFVRKFILEHALRAFKEAASANEPLDQKYSRLLGISELFNRMLSPKAERGASANAYASSDHIGKLMFEKNFVGALTSAIADLDLNFPNAKRAVKYILGPLKQLTDLGVSLSQSSDMSSTTAGTTDEEEISSATSVSDDEDDEREQTPDLYRNSTLGMFESSANRDDEDSESTDSDGEDDDEMDYDEYGDEMDYEEEPIRDHDEVVSDEDEDLDEMDDMDDMGEIEGVPGDVEIDVDVVMDHQDGEGSDSEDSSDGEDEDDDDAEDEDVDFGNDMDEITGDDENASMPGVADEIDWEDDLGDIGADGGSPHGGPLDPIAQAIAEERSDDDGGDGVVHIDMGEGDEEYFDDELPPGAEDEDDEDDEVDYENDVVYEPGLEGVFVDLSQLLAAIQNLDVGAEEDDDEQEMRWDLDAPLPSTLIRGHHHHHHHHRPQFEMFGMIGGDSFRAPGLRTHRPAPNGRSEDDGTNPLLQRDGSAAAPSARRDRELSARRSLLRGPGGDLLRDLVAHGGGHTINVNIEPRLAGGLPPMFALEDRHGRALMDIDPSRPWREQLGLPRFSDIMPSHRSHERNLPNSDEAQAVEFRPVGTMMRWQEEAKMLFSGKHHEKATRIANSLHRLLMPAAMEAKRVRDKAEAERRAAEEKAREEEERRKREEEEARKKREEEERKAKEAEEAAERARLAQEAAEAEESTANEADGTSMEGVESSAAAAAGSSGDAQQASTSEEAPARIMTTIRGRELDITHLGIDLDFLNGLPEELREEVVMGQLQEQRSQAAEAGEQPSEISREFLEALPPDIQRELLRQEEMERRRRQQEESRRRAAQEGNAPAAIPEDMNNADFLAMLEPALRQAILMDSDDATIAALPEHVRAEARALRPEVQRRAEGFPAHRGGRLGGAMADRDRVLERNNQEAQETSRQRRPIVQMLDKAGIATLLRLMFVSLPQKAKNNLHSVLSDVCKNTQNRAEVISILLSILQDGTLDVTAVERSFAALSLRAKQQAAPKTPQPLKRTPTGTVVTPAAELSPLNIVHSCLMTLNALTMDNTRVPSFFLTEHENFANSRIGTAKKGKGKEVRAAKFPLNSLLALLDRKLITENTGVMETLASLLNRVTQPLHILSKRAKEREEAEKAKAEKAKAKEAADNAAESTTAPEGGEVQMGDAAEAPTNTDAPTTEAAATGEAAPGTTEGDAAEDKSEDAAKKDEGSKPEEKKARDPVPPEVPEENIRLVVNIMTARECPSKTFQDTLDVIRNLSGIPGAREIFGRELARQAQSLSEDVLRDLEELAKQIDSAQSETDLQGLALANFSSATAKPTKLLRVIIAIDYLSNPSKSNDGSSLDPKLKEDILAVLYEGSTFDKLWANLSRCLTAIRIRGNMINVATILLPLIEALMVVCRNTTLSESSADAASPLDKSDNPSPESRLETLFFQFTEEHRKILNELIRNNHKLMNQNFDVLAKNSKVLEFDNKRSYFNRKVHDRREQRVAHPSLQLNVRRDQVFLDSFKSLYYKSGNEIKYGKLNIRFHGEEGIDAGGVSREWFAAMARQMFNPDYALFNPVASDRTTFHPNPLSAINGEHLMFFKFIGRIIGKALYEGRVLDCHFSRAVYRRILGKSVSLKDMESLDLDYYKSLVWILENDITDITFETFSVDIDRFGVSETVDLVPDGRNIAVTEENKQEYVRLVVEHKLIKSVEEQLEEFLKGFHEIIPAELISIFNEQELELLISGLPEIDIDDWKNNTEYQNYQPTSPQIQWFWRAVRSFDKEEKAKLLQFVTGTSKVPLNGFKELEGMNGFAKFNIHRDYSSKEKLPSSHTCFNQLDLPEYESYEHLRQQLYTAITAGSEYFGFA